MFRSNTLRQRVVINVDTAERLGTVSDIEIDERSGRITKIIVRRSGFFSCFMRFRELIVPWDAITAAGREFILVKTYEIGEKCLKKNENCGII